LSTEYNQNVIISMIWWKIPELHSGRPDGSGSAHPQHVRTW